MRTALVLAALLVVVTACEYPRDAIEIRNGTGENIRVARLVDGQTLIENLPPRQVDRFREECLAEGGLVATSLENGRVIEEMRTQLCQGDDTWVIDGEP